MTQSSETVSRQIQRARGQSLMYQAMHSSYLREPLSFRYVWFTWRAAVRLNVKSQDSEMMQEKNLERIAWIYFLTNRNYSGLWWSGHNNIDECLNCNSYRTKMLAIWYLWIWIFSLKRWKQESLEGEAFVIDWSKQFLMHMPPENRYSFGGGRVVATNDFDNTS